MASPHTNVASDEHEFICTSPNRLSRAASSDTYDAWPQWAAEKYRQRGFLALCAEECPVEVIDAIERVEHSAGIPREADRIVAIAAVDGSVEYSQACASRFQFNGVDANIVGAKDAEFYSRVSRIFAYADATVLELQSRSCATGADSRLFQDACISVFRSEQDIDAITSAFEIHDRLSDFNKRANRPWPEQLHARIVIGRRWADVLPCLRWTQGRETVIEGSLWDELNDDLRRILFAAGVRRGGRVAMPDPSSSRRVVITT